MTLFALRDRDSLMAVRFAMSPVWETQAALQALTDERGRTYHQPWLAVVQPMAAGLDLAPLRTALPRRGYVPDFLTPPPATGRATFAGQLAQVRATDPEHVARELQWCRDSVHGGQHSRILTDFLADPERARDDLAVRLEEAWTNLIAPFWVRIRALLERDIEQRSRAVARYGLRRALDQVHPKMRWTADGLRLTDCSDQTVEVDQRGLVLMPSVYLWPHVAAITESPWLPTVIYPAAGIAELWHVPAPPPHALGRLLGTSRARVLACLDRPLSTTVLAAITGLSTAGVSAHLLTLRDAGLLSVTRHGHEVRYHRTELGSAILEAQADDQHLR
jgi:DNA-binding transcriptional ArsR family regulator